MTRVRTRLYVWLRVGGKFSCVEEALVLLGHRLDAFPRSLTQTLRVGDDDGAAAVADESGLFEDADGDGDAGAAHAEHVREEFLRERQLVAFEPAAAHQKPARQTLLDRVQGVARRGQRDLRDEIGRAA